MNKLLLGLGIIVAAAALAGGGVLLRQQAEPLVLCKPNLMRVSHDEILEFKFYLNANNKNSKNFDIDSLSSVAESGLALRSNLDHLNLSGPLPKKDPNVVDTLTLGKDKIIIIPLKDDRDQTEQEISLHVGVKLIDKQRTLNSLKPGNVNTVTSTLCLATISHISPKKVSPPSQPTKPPKVTPPIIYKDKTGNFVEPAKVLKFKSSYKKFGEGVSTQIQVSLIPESLAGKAIAGLELVLKGSGYTLPTVSSNEIELNGGAPRSSDWQCSNTGDTFCCNGKNILKEGVASRFVFNFASAVNNPPAFIKAKLLAPDGITVLTTIDIPYLSTEI